MKPQNWSRRAWIAAAVIGLLVMLTADYPANPAVASGLLVGIVAVTWLLAWAFDYAGRVVA